MENSTVSSNAGHVTILLSTVKREFRRYCNQKPAMFVYIQTTPWIKHSIYPEELGIFET